MIESLVDISADDIDEDETLYVEGETPSEDDGTDIPVRVLSNFTVYNASTLQAIPVAELLHLSFSKDEFRASGFVKAWVDDSDIPSDILDDDSGSGVGEGAPVEGVERVTLSEILEFSIHNKSEDADGLDRYVLVQLPTRFSTNRTLQAKYIFVQNSRGTYWGFHPALISRTLRRFGFNNESFTFSSPPRQKIEDLHIANLRATLPF